MKRQLTIFILLTINLTVFGQHDLGLKINGGLSRISNSRDISNGTNRIPFVLSGHGGLFYSLQLGNKSLLGAELLFVQIEGKERMETDVLDDYGNPTGELIIGDIWRHISYIGFPIYYGLKINNLTINLGFQASFTLTSSGREKVQFPYNGDIITLDNKYDELYIDNYDFGSIAEVIFNLNDRFAIEGTYYYGVNNILNNDVSNRTWRVQQATFGLRYTFLTMMKN